MGARRQPIPRLSSKRRENNTNNQQIASNNLLSTCPVQSSRFPLRSRDANNVMNSRGPQKGTPLTSKSGNAIMQEKPTYNGASRPTLSQAVGKTPNKVPLTPKIAASKAPVTPRLRQDGNSVTAGPQKEEILTPVSTFLTNNITPRSSSRKSRVDSANSTPTSTPVTSTVPESSRAYITTPIQGVTSLGGVVSSETGPRRLAVSFSPAISEGEHLRDHPHLAEDKFFYANDVKSGTQATSRRPPLSSKSSSSSFLYANGETIPQALASPGSSVGPISSGEEKNKPKFFHANGTPDFSPAAPFALNTSQSALSVTSQPSSINHASQKLIATPSSPKPRPPSSPPKSVDMVHPASKTMPVLSPPNISRAHSFNTRQNDIYYPSKDSLEISGETPGHENILSSEKLDDGREDSTTVSTTSPSTVGDLASGSHTSALQVVSDLYQGNPDLSVDTQSSVKAMGDLDRMNELAANARRERKVLDLEITNSSLAAINRTLEREMRKQTAELRRFRRLSRSGRLSLMTSNSTRTSIASLTTDGTDLAQLSDLAEDEEIFDDYGSDTSEMESVDDGSLSPRALAESDARHRKRDEKRLQLDLSKHQQLLIDSQKINQSLKRCLGWTEELITEGKKALDYQVRVSDVELGGRVLAFDDVDDAESEDFSISHTAPDPPDPLVSIRGGGEVIQEMATEKVG